MQAGAEPVAVALALDREERGQGERSAVQEVEALYGLRCVTILTFSELIAALEAPPRPDTAAGVPRGTDAGAPSSARPRTAGGDARLPSQIRGHDA